MENKLSGNWLCFLSTIATSLCDCLPISSLRVGLRYGDDDDDDDDDDDAYDDDEYDDDDDDDDDY